MIAAERERLAGPFLIGAFAVVFAAMLAAVFPTSDEYADFASTQKPNAFSVAYLHALNRANPNDEKLRMVYARHLAQVGRAADALEALRSVANGRGLADEARDLSFDLALVLVHEAPSPAERRRAVDGAVQRLTDLVGRPHSADRLRALTDAALELERPDLAARALLELARVDTDRAARLAEAGKWFRASGAVNAAADAYRQAVAMETDPEKGRTYALDAIAALRAGSRVCDAAEVANELARAHWDEPATATSAMDLAVECGNAKLARDLGRRVVELSSDSDDLLFAQVKRELAAGDLAAAFMLMQELVKRQPDEPSLREIDSRIAEWAGHPEVALQDWLYLMGRPVVPPRRFELP